jgi:U3 small nucleolar ribonucleoprotein protein IMP3
MEGQILSKLYDMGVLNSQAKLSDVDNKLTVAAFCRRRLAVIMVTSKMAETVSAVSTVFLIDGMCQAHPKSGGQIH